LSNQGVYLSSDNGASWSPFKTGLTDNTINALSIRDDYLFAGSETSGVWCYPLSEINSVKPGRPEALPAVFSLEQNYPNPFNPLTVIRFHVSRRSHIRLQVYNILGEEVATLINEKKNQGDYTVTFDASALASGMYLYRLSGDDFVSTKKMLYLR
jgi:hypothetical protein